MITRRNLISAAGAAAGLSAVGAGRLAEAAKLNDDGLHVQDWFIDSFLDMREDVQTAHDEGRNFAVIIEQRGCPYCKKTHEINFAHPKVAEYIPANFDMVQLNLHGSRAVTDFDGEELEERAVARKWQANFTPTILFFPPPEDLAEGKTGRDLEVARLPGYFRPFTFMQMFKFVREGGYRESNFQAYLGEQVRALEAQGGDPANW
jgi:thioredoxin-related protein